MKRTELLPEIRKRRFREVLSAGGRVGYGRRKRPGYREAVRGCVAVTSAGSSKRGFPASLGQDSCVRLGGEVLQIPQDAATAIAARRRSGRTGTGRDRLRFSTARRHPPAMRPRGGCW